MGWLFDFWARSHDCEVEFGKLPKPRIPSRFIKPMKFSKIVHWHSSAIYTRKSTRLERLPALIVVFVKNCSHRAYIFIICFFFFYTKETLENIVLMGCA